MRTRSDLIKSWNTLEEEQEKGGKKHIREADLFDVLLDIREILQIKANDIIGCTECGLKKKYWDKMFCGAGGDHRE